MRYNILVYPRKVYYSGLIDSNFQSKDSIKSTSDLVFTLARESIIWRTIKQSLALLILPHKDNKW